MFSEVDLFIHYDFYSAFLHTLTFTSTLSSCSAAGWWQHAVWKMSYSIKHTIQHKWILSEESAFRISHSDKNNNNVSPAVFPLELDEIWTSVGGTIVLVCSALVLTTRYLLQTHCWQHKMHHSPVWQKISHPKRPQRRWVFISGDVAACVKRPAFESPSCCRVSASDEDEQKQVIYVNVWQIFYFKE